MTAEETELAGALGERPAFVPTMGALHEGHVSLIRHAAGLGHQVVVSIFVNPTQFAPNEDLATYPRTREDDIERAREAGADVIFIPDEQVVYPGGSRAAERGAAAIQLPEVATRPGLEDACRRHFFGGVCLVVGRLFDLIRPGPAIFGEKDYQQFMVIRSMVQEQAERFEGIEVIGSPTIREPDGLAMSSRNVRLTSDTRERALGPYRALQAAGQAETPREAEASMAEVLDAHDLEIQYAVIRDAETLEAVSDDGRPMRALIAATLDGLRLIDNAPYPG